MARKPTNLSTALKYAAAGIPVFPCDFNTKQPLTRNGFKDATSDADKVSAWWKRYPQAYIGAPNTSFVVLDLDLYKAKNHLADLMAEIIGTLQETKAIPESMMMVNTRSGGQHLYYAKNSSVGRKINAIPFVDILGAGGYVILPDQKDYVCTTTEEPWSVVQCLTSFDLDYFEQIVEGIEPLVTEAKKMASVKKKGRPSKEVPEIIQQAPVIKEKAKRKMTLAAAIKSGNVGVTAEELASKDSVYYDRDGNSISRVNKGMYRPMRPNKEAPEQTITIDHDFDKDGPLFVSHGDLTGPVTTALFHNPTVQKKIGWFLGLQVPETASDTTYMHSILPGHTDNRKSMGVRWSKDGSHLLIRDFSNFAGDRYNQVDYNVVRIYASLKKNGIAGRMSPSEHTIWFVRLMHEANVIVLDEKLYKQFPRPTTGMKESEVRLLSSFQYLDALKSTHPDYDGNSVFSINFGKAWSGLSDRTFRNARSILLQRGYLSVMGLHDCSGKGDEDSFWNSKLLRINPTDKKEPSKLDEFESYCPFQKKMVKVRMDGFGDLRQERSRIRRLKRIYGEDSTAVDATEEVQPTPKKTETVAASSRKELNSTVTIERCIEKEESDVPETPTMKQLKARKNMMNISDGRNIEEIEVEVKPSNEVRLRATKVTRRNSARAPGSSTKRTRELTLKEKVLAERPLCIKPNMPWWIRPRKDEDDVVERTVYACGTIEEITDHTKHYEKLNEMRKIQNE